MNTYSVNAFQSYENLNDSPKAVLNYEHEKLFTIDFWSNVTFFFYLKTEGTRGRSDQVTDPHFSRRNLYQQHFSHAGKEPLSSITIVALYTRAGVSNMWPSDAVVWPTLS